MTESSQTEDNAHEESRSASPPGSASPEDTSKAQPATKSRKRTKTGCLTCRKRRIKCDEQRPTCHNCFKSKRQCEGYQTRLQFRPQGDFGMPFGANLSYGQFPPQFYGAPGQYASIRPRPYHGTEGQPGPVPDAAAQWHPQQMPLVTSPGFSPSGVSPVFASHLQQHVGPAPAHGAGFPNAAMAASLQPQNVQPELGGQFPYHGVDAYGQAMALGPQGMVGSVSTAGSVPGYPPMSSAPGPVSSEGHVWNPRIHDYDANLYSTIPAEQFNFAETLIEDDLFDVDSDEEMGEALGHSEETGLPLMMSVHGKFNIRSLRTHDTFLNTPNILVNYEPQWHASPLMNPTTARIFGHFIAVTACHLSLGQRRASNPSLLFQHNPVPKSHQGLWTYILPQKALSNQGLMHAILALASLQIAMLQGTDRHTARKHYHFAIRRNGRAVGLPKKRTSVATIATTLLLACFEVWAGDHSNWNSHLVGARQLFMEIDFKGRTRRIRQEKGNFQTQERTLDINDSYAAFIQGRSGPFSLQADMPDVALLEKFMGYRVPYGDDTTGDEDAKSSHCSEPLAQSDIDTYDMYSDLWWFYVKQDIYYSTISSNPLLLPYSRWGDCPPRAPIGRTDAIYGTMDHLLLILGRIAKFLSEDLVRKKKAVEANGGKWRPPPGMFPGGPPGRPPGAPPPTPTSASGAPRGGTHMPGKNPSAGAGSPPAGAPSPTGPGFMGMIPDPPTPRMPAAFKDGGGGYIPVRPAQEEIPDLEFALESALREWNEIQSVLSIFESLLQGPEWQPLPITAAPPIATHFGSALQFGDYRIADIWAMFYTCKIIMARVHPGMPPAALVAAGIAAPQTAAWANTIGKIVFGMQVPAADEALNPTFASVLTQNMFCLFFAGVQFREAAQRLVTVQRLQYISEKVGHESSALIGAALETTWVKAFEMGRGPEWRRVLRLEIDGGSDESRKKEFRTVDKTKEGTTVYIPGDSLRQNWGRGVMGLETDFARLSASGREDGANAQGKSHIRGTKNQDGGADPSSSGGGRSMYP